MFIANNKKKRKSIRDLLRKKDKSNETFEYMLSNLSIEEVIALKMEISIRENYCSHLYGIPFWKLFPEITRSALLRWAVAATATQKETAFLLGIDQRQLRRLMHQYKIMDSFDEETSE